MFMLDSLLRIFCHARTLPCFPARPDSSGRVRGQAYYESRGPSMMNSRLIDCWNNNIVGCRKQHTQKNLIYIEKTIFNKI